MENTNTDPKGMSGEEVVGEMKQEVGKYVDTAKEYWDELGDELKQKGKIAREGVNKAKRYADMYARENPWKLVGIAAIVGAVAGLVLSSCKGCGRGKSCRHHDHNE